METRALPSGREEAGLGLSGWGKVTEGRESRLPFPGLHWRASPPGKRPLAPTGPARQALFSLPCSTCRAPQQVSGEAMLEVSPGHPTHAGEQFEWEGQQARARAGHPSRNPRPHPRLPTGPDIFHFPAPTRPTPSAAPGWGCRSCTNAFMSRPGLGTLLKQISKLLQLNSVIISAAPVCRGPGSVQEAVSRLCSSHLGRGEHLRLSPRLGQSGWGVNKASAHRAGVGGQEPRYMPRKPSDTAWSLPGRRVPRGSEVGDWPVGDPFLSRRSSHKQVRPDVRLATHPLGITFTDTQGLLSPFHVWEQQGSEQWPEVTQIEPQKAKGIP